MKPLAKLSLIAAMSDNGVIGRDNRLPWRLPADLAHFKRLTIGKPIIMGRRTWESLPGLLPQRRHIVVTRDAGYRADGALVVHSLHEAIAAAGDVDEMLIVGGADLYAQTIPLATRMYLTYVHDRIAGDAHFPEFDADQWKEVARERHGADERNPHDYSFVELVRV
ncbi:MAG: type 3 dihydrofolate reductase [Gammaproteobacteria bacterium]|nr:type 3 dihydrofolate reductase [Gammaproteobacteria bacterium]